VGANGIGDACQCDDVNGDSVCNVTDALEISRGQVGSAPSAQLCPVYLGTLCP
jgi:hypothetical protein